MTTFQRLILAIFVLLICTGFDQVTKDIAQEKFASVPTISLLNDTIRIQYSENSGAMLGLGSRLPGNVRFMLFVLFNGLISGTTLIYALKTRDLHFMQLISLLLIASGGMGNLLDRLLNNGAAIDFMNLGIGSLRTGIFNVADLFIVVGVSLFGLFGLKDQRKEAVT